MFTASDISKSIRKRIWWILGSLVLVSSIMYYLTGKMAKKYKSKAQISTGITESSEINLGDTKEIIQPFAISQRFSNLIEMLRSRQCVNLVQYQLLIHELNDPTPFRTPNHLPKIDANFKKKLTIHLRKKIDSCEVLISSNKSDNDIQNFLKLYNYDQDDILSKITIKRIPDSDFIGLEVETENANLSAFIANTFVEEFIKFYNIQRSNKSAGSVNFFEKMVKIKKKELDAKVNELKSYKLKNRVINLYEQTKSIVNQLSSIEILREQENMKISSREKAADEIDEKFTSKEKKYYEAVSIKVNEEIEEVKNKINKYNAQFIKSNFKDSTAKDSVETLRNQMTKLVNQASFEALVNPNEIKKELIARKLHSELEVEIAQKTVESIDKDIARLQGIISAFAPMEASIGAYEREISVASEVYLLVLNKLNIAQFAALNDNNTLKQAEKAVAADKPESSKKIIILSLSSGLTLIIGLMIAIGMAYFDNRFYNPNRFILSTDLHLINYLPEINSQEIEFHDLFHLSDITQKESLFANNIRKIRQEIESKTHPNTSILFTSIKNQEGKSIILLALAYSMSLTGKKILIIDANFKNNDLTNILNANQSLSSQINATQENLISKTNLENVDIIGAANNSASPSEIFQKQLDRNLYMELKQKYDYIFLEGPCLQYWADSREISSKCEYVVSIFSASNQISDQEKESYEFLLSLEQKHIGSILNLVQNSEIKSIIQLKKDNKSNTSKKLFKI